MTAIEEKTRFLLTLNALLQLLDGSVSYGLMSLGGAQLYLPQRGFHVEIVAPVNPSHCSYAADALIMHTSQVYAPANGQLPTVSS